MDDIRKRIVELLPRLRRFAYSLTGDMDRADDLVQDTCERAFQRLDQWQPGTQLHSWLFRIAQNLWVDQYRAAKHRRNQGTLEELENLSGSDGRSVMESRMTLDAVMLGMDRLPEEQRVLVSLVCVEGLSYKEAASILSVPIGTVMSRLARARQALYAAISDTTLDPGAFPAPLPALKP